MRLSTLIARSLLAGVTLFSTFNTATADITPGGSDRNADLVDHFAWFYENNFCDKPFFSYEPGSIMADAMGTSERSLRAISADTDGLILSLTETIGVRRDTGVAETRMIRRMQFDFTHLDPQIREAAPGFSGDEMNACHSLTLSFGTADGSHLGVKNMDTDVSVGAWTFYFSADYEVDEARATLESLFKPEGEAPLVFLRGFTD